MTIVTFDVAVSGDNDLAMARHTLISITEKSSQSKAATVLALLASVCIAANAAELPREAATSHSRFLMGTICEVTIEGDAVSTEPAFEEIARVEQLISTWRDSSELSKLNRTGDEIVSAELYTLLERAMREARETGGAFNPLVGALLRIWKVRDDGAVPASAEIERTLPLLALDGPTLDSSTRRITLPRDVSIEEGGFGKGYALDRAASVLTSGGAQEFLIDFGGQLMVRSCAPIEVAIANPERRDEAALLLNLTEGSLSTSSGSEKQFVVDGERFSHIVDPRDGHALPPRGSVSVVSSSALEADSLSTAIYVLGPEAGLRWANEHEIAAIFIIPSTAGWDVLLSERATSGGFAPRAAGAEVTIKGTTR